MTTTKRGVVRDALAHRTSGAVPHCVSLAGDAFDAYHERLLDDYATPAIRDALAGGLVTTAQAVSLAIGNHLVQIVPPWWNWYNVPEAFSREDTPEDLPDVIGTGDYEGFFKTVKYLRDEMGVYTLAVVWGSHFEKAQACRGIENFLADIAADPDWAQRLLDTIIRKNMVMLENIAPFPELDGILLGSDWGAQRDLLLSPEAWRRMIRGGEQREYDLIHRYGKDVFVHSCGKIDRVIGDLCDMGLDVLNPVQPECMDIYQLKDTYGARLTFYGGIGTQRVLPYGSPEEVREETRRVTRSMSRDGGYIIASSQDVQADVPYENLRALIDTAREFG